MYYAAQLFHPGETLEDIHQAHESALRAVHEGERRARWLGATSYDRWLFMQGLVQCYGTNYLADGARHRLIDVDSATTDAERAQWDVPPLTEQRHEAEEATRVSPPAPVLTRQTLPQWMRIVMRRWQHDPM